MSQVVDDPLELAARPRRRAAPGARRTTCSSRPCPPGGGRSRAPGRSRLLDRELDEAIACASARTPPTRGGRQARGGDARVWLSGDYFSKAAICRSSSGWFAKAERLLEGKEESTAHGYLAFAQATNLMMTRRPRRLDREGGPRRSRSRRRSQTATCDAMALVFKGRALVLSGEVAEGLALLDEATAAAISGELEPFPPASSTASRSRRATASATTPGRRVDGGGEPLVRPPGRHRVPRRLPRPPGEHQAPPGRLARAREQQALQACEELQGFDAGRPRPASTRSERSAGGEATSRRPKRRTGKAKEWGRDPQPGLALLRLAQGKTDAAAAAIKRPRRGSGSAQPDPPPPGPGRDRPRRRRPQGRARGRRSSRARGLQARDARRPRSRRPLSRLGPDPARRERLRGRGDQQLERAVETWRKVGAPVRGGARPDAPRHGLRARATRTARATRSRRRRRPSSASAPRSTPQRAAELLGEHQLDRTFMFTDIVDSTKLVEALGEEKWQKLLTWHDRSSGTRSRARAAR